jgi:hypothetical protein
MGCSESCAIAAGFASMANKSTGNRASDRAIALP